jgi:hypothetical protein
MKDTGTADSRQKSSSELSNTLRRRWHQRLLPAVASVAISASVASISFGLIAIFPDPSDSPTHTQSAAMAELNDMRARANAQEVEIRKLEAKVRLLMEVAESPTDAMHVAALKENVKEAFDRLEQLEMGLLQNPEKALSVPLLRQDLDNMKSVYRADTLAAGKQIDRVYDMSKWFLGLMGTMAVGLLGLTVGFLWRTRNNTQDSDLFSVSDIE